MKQRSLGCTGTALAELGLGTMNFGWRISASTSLALLDAYHAEGGNFIQAVAPDGDSGPASLAASETLVGDWRRARGHARPALFLATRVNLRRLQPLSPRGFSEQLRRTVDASLARFQTDYLDLLVGEWSGPDPITPVIRETLDGPVRTGRVRYVAFAGLPAWQMVTELHRGSTANHSRIDAVQADYSLLARTEVETELGGACASRRLGLVVRSPLAGGLLAKREGGVLALGSSRVRWLVDRYGLDGGAKVVRAVNQLAREHDCTPAQVALAWVLHHPHVTSALIGAHSVASLRELVGAGRCTLSPSDLERLDRASSTQRLLLPPRGRPAPSTDRPCLAPSILHRETKLQTA